MIYPLKEYQNHIPKWSMSSESRNNIIIKNPSKSILNSVLPQTIVTIGMVTP